MEVGQANVQRNPGGEHISLTQAINAYIGEVGGDAASATSTPEPPPRVRPYQASSSEQGLSTFEPQGMTLTQAHECWEREEKAATTP